MWHELIDDIRKIERRYGDELNSSASDQEIEKLEVSAQKKFNTNIPDGYKELLRNVNGIDFNGLVIYGAGIENLYEFFNENEIIHNNNHNKRYLFFADSDLSWFCLDLISEEFLELDKQSGMEVGKYQSFDDMIVNALKIALDV
ncbi:SMI1/KNR4 family protein [Bacillus spizizenii]|nr:SMI1/KNR4 family protein [Bacillus spizizenii]MCY9125016.1 SMI1/KNR4 family protein [Bacillus spizizenii]